MNQALIELIINKLKTAKVLNDNLQNENTMVGHQDWHTHESIDDLITECLCELGD